jgi:acetyl-CoA carboxylase carboxyltransferase component
MEDCNMSLSKQTTAVNRIHQLLDENSFVELGSYVTARSTDFNMAGKETPGDGVITGYGTIDGNLVYVYSQDSEVLGGSMGEMHAKKIVSLYAQAMKMGAPIVGLVDCAGLRLQEATDALDGFGKLYLSQTMASGVIPQIQAVFGMCGGGMAVSSALCDFTFMEDRHAKLFINSPNAIEGNSDTECDTAGALFQSEKSGLADFTGSEQDVIAAVRTLVSIIPSNNEDDLSYTECTDDLNRLVPEIAGSASKPGEILGAVSDNHFFYELGKSFGTSVMTAFIRLNGNTVGCVANAEQELTHSGCDKAASFIGFCDAFNIPVLTLVNVSGYAATKCTERHMAKSAAALTYAYADANVPKVTVVTGTAFGTAYLTMGSKSIGADVVYAWPDAAIGMMDAKEAAKIMYADEIAKADDQNALIDKKAEEYAALQSSAMSAAKRGYVDDIIEPASLRKRTIAAFEMLFTKREDRPVKKHGTV